jgi:uncharacterized protein YrrD
MINKEITALPLCRCDYCKTHIKLRGYMLCNGAFAKYNSTRQDVRSFLMVMINKELFLYIPNCTHQQHT